MASQLVIGHGVLTEIENEICHDLAGRAAERLVFGSVSAGAGGSATSDLSQATRRAVGIETTWGLGELGPLWLPAPETVLLTDEKLRARVRMHRYRPDTVSVVLNDYIREFISKLQAERGRLEKLVDDPNATQSQRVKAQKDVGAVIKQIAELEEWEREVVFPLAQAKIEIDLDDGVKRNYPKFGAALKAIKGLEAADE